MGYNVIFSLSALQKIREFIASPEGGTCFLQSQLGRQICLLFLPVAGPQRRMEEPSLYTFLPALPVAISKRAAIIGMAAENIDEDGTGRIHPRYAALWRGPSLSTALSLLRDFGDPLGSEKMDALCLVALPRLNRDPKERLIATLHEIGHALVDRSSDKPEFCWFEEIGAWCRVQLHVPEEDLLTASVLSLSALSSHAKHLFPDSDPPSTKGIDLGLAEFNSHLPLRLREEA